MGERNTISSSFTVNTIEDGKDGMVYEIVSSVGSVTIPSDASTAALSATLSFYRRQGAGAREAYSCCYSVFRKNGTTYTKTRSVSTKSTTGSTGSMSLAAAGSGAANAADAVVVCIYDSYSESHSGYLAELEIPVRKNGDTGEQGEPGDDGQDAATLVFEPDTVFVPCDADGSVTDTFSMTTAIYIEIKGVRYAPDANTATVDIIADYVDTTWGTNRRSLTVELDGGMEDFEGYIKVSATKTLNGVTYTASGLLPVVAVMRGEDGSPGPRGLAGPMAYIAGKYDATVNYGNLLTETTCPVVLYTDGYYWYPTEDYRGTGYPPSVANGWKKAESFEMILTKVLFAQFAKLGGFVVSGDYMLSHYGELIDANGNKLTLTEVTDDNGFRSWRYNGVDAYTYFRDYDPMVEVYRDMNTATYFQYYNSALDYPLLVRNNWQDWSYYETTSDTFYITLKSSDQHINNLKNLAVNGLYYLCGTDTNNVFHRLLMRKSQAVGSNNRLYGTRQAIMEHLSQTMFRPAKVVNAVTGEEWMAGGKVHVTGDGDVTIEGTVRAKNLFRNVCTFVDGGTYFNRNGEQWYYNPTTGGYELNPATTSGKVQCIYDADIVFMLGRGASGWQNDDPVFMPRAAAFQGKIIEFIVKCDTSGAGTIYIGAVGSSNSMGSNEIAMLTSAVPTGDKYNLQPIQTSNNCFVAAPDTRVRFISMPDSYGVWKWVVVDETNI